MSFKIIILAAVVAIVSAELPIKKTEEIEIRPRSARGVVSGLGKLGAAKISSFPNFPGFNDLLKSFVCTESTESDGSWWYVGEIGNLLNKAGLCPLDLLRHFCPGCTESSACSRPANRAVPMHEGLKNFVTLVLQKL